MHVATSVAHLPWHLSALFLGECKKGSTNTQSAVQPIVMWAVLLSHAVVGRSKVRMTHEQTNGEEC